MNMDIKIKCKNCGVSFVFTEGEQKFFKKLVDEGKIPEYILPKRCKACRDSMKSSFAQNNLNAPQKRYGE